MTVSLVFSPVWHTNLPWFLTDSLITKFSPLRRLRRVPDGCILGSISSKACRWLFSFKIFFESQTVWTRKRSRDPKPVILLVEKPALCCFRIPMCFWCCFGSLYPKIQVHLFGKVPLFAPHKLHTKATKRRKSRISRLDSTKNLRTIRLKSLKSEVNKLEHYAEVYVYNIIIHVPAVSGFIIGSIYVSWDYHCHKRSCGIEKGHKT